MPYNAFEPYRIYIAGQTGTSIPITITDNILFEPTTIYLGVKNNSSTATPPLIFFVRSGVRLGHILHTTSIAAGSTYYYCFSQTMGITGGSAPYFIAPLPQLPVLMQNDQIIITTVSGTVSITVNRAEIVGRKWVQV
ncbi:MAG: hypothetical protein QW658_04290 [Candidatus Bathyarchaeia archaeon]